MDLSPPLLPANLLNSFFASCFTIHSDLPPTKPPQSNHPELSSIECTEEVYKQLCSLKVKTCTGISSHMLRNTSSSISSSLCKLFKHSLSTGCFPTERKTSNATPVFKSGDKGLVFNYNSVSLLSIPSRILERVVHQRLLHHLLSNSIISPRQFGFRPGGSTREALLTATHNWQSNLERRNRSAALFLDISKAFDKVPHHNLLLSLSSVGITGPLLKWYESYLSNCSQRVVLSGHTFSPAPVKSGVPQGSILGTLLFVVYVNSLASLDLSPGTSIILFADDILLYCVLTASSDSTTL